jgi:hypothetical protein
MLTTTIARAQDKNEVDTGEIKSWFEQNWIWVAGGVVLLILIILLSRGNKVHRFRVTRKTTTVIKDEGGHTKTVTTTEEKI